MPNKILIIGMGSVGLATAIGFANVGYSLSCYDINKEKIAMLKKGKAPFFEHDLQHCIDIYRDNIFFTSNLAEAFKDTNIFFICVGTPLGENNSVDMVAFRNAIEAIVNNVKYDSTIVIKSTVPIGTNKKVVQYIKSLRLSFKINVVSNPEFLSQGTAIKDTIQASRIIIGYNEPESRDLMLDIYKHFDVEKIATTPESAELIKYESNCYLAMRISFVNDLAYACDLVGADLISVLKGVSLDSRIGNYYFSPGLGYGGSCFPKDTICFHHQLQSEYGYELELIEATIDINQRQPLRLCRKIIQNYGSILNRNISVLGLAFKKDTDDVRDSLALAVVSYLIDNGAKVTVWDPVANTKAKEIFKNAVTYAKTLEDAVNQSDIIFIATDWDEIVNIQLSSFIGKDVYDGRNCFLKRREEIKFNYYYVGGVIQ